MVNINQEKTGIFFYDLSEFQETPVHIPRKQISSLPVDIIKNTLLNGENLLHRWFKVTDNLQQETQT